MSVCRHQQTLPLTATSDECHQLAPVWRHHVEKNLTVTALTTRDVARYWSNIAIFRTLPAFDTPIGGGSPSEYCLDV